jgi:hypothetical protein
MTQTMPASTEAIPLASASSSMAASVTGPMPTAPCAVAMAAMTIAGSSRRWPIQAFSAGRPRQSAS